ncbi:hypothetical protein BH11ACT2_BH11ACT2_09840 [soil metagenome]
MFTTAFTTSLLMPTPAGFPRIAGFFGVLTD